MMSRKIVFEGSEAQIDRLISIYEASKNMEVDLPELRDNYYQTENLWCIEDVKNRYKCTDEEAMEVLESALQNDATMEQIWFAINFHTEEMGLEEVEEK
jgi:hypothetical protein